MKRGCKQPRLQLCCGSRKLVAFGRPDVEMFCWGKVARFCLCVRQAQGESAQRFIVRGHYLLKIIVSP